MMMVDNTQQTRTIRCTPDNVAEMRALVKAWPELHALVTAMQTQDLFAGLRGLQITLTGTPEYIAKGLGAVNPVISSTTPKAQ